MTKPEQTKRNIRRHFQEIIEESNHQYTRIELSDSGVLRTVQNILSDLESICQEVLGDSKATDAVTDAKSAVFKVR